MEPEGEPKKHEIDHHVDTTATANVAGGETETPRPITGSGKSAMATDADTQQEQQGEQGPEDHGIQHDSMVTVRLSEPSLVPSPPPALRVDTNVVSGSLKRRRSAVYVKRSDAEERDDIMAAGGATPTVKDDDSAASITTPSRTDSIAAEQMSPIVIEAPMSLRQELEDSDEQEDDDGVQTPGEGSSDDDDDDANAPAWARMQETEDEAGKGMGKDVDNSTATLLAKLEQENNRIATNPRSVRAEAIEAPSPPKRPQPQFMAQLRNMVSGRAVQALRYSILPPPPMTDLEFYSALVKDYAQTAARLPTLLQNKVRKGVPPPLRGVVWQSMASAATAPARDGDASLADTYDRLLGEPSPYEGPITKDFGRFFPGVDMFREPDGHGQQMLARVLKCFSLYDQHIGYCTGLAFIVGPLLMHMPDKQAFCILVRLMEHYDLRSSFLPDFYGLHVRVYQFRELLRQQLPELSTHLDDLQVDPVYVSQWFLSFFAVTCPLPMLFRIYDVIFAEGASETLMRVALSLMHKNQARLLACTELEDVMQLLLSRGIWDCYHYNADELVSDFVSFSEVVTRERLQALEVSFREAQIASNLNSTSANAARTSEVTTAAASRFLGRLWTSSSSTATATSTSSSTTRTITSGGGTSPTLSTPRTANNLSPGLNPPRPLSMLRRSASKQSLASTLNSMEAGSAVSLFSSASNTTDATSVTRDSSNTSDDFSSTNPATYNGVAGNATKTAGSAGGRAADDRYLHSQIEDLLTALSELQRNHAALASQLQREREEREEDRRAVLAFVDAVRAPKPKPRGVTLITSNGTPANTPTQPPDLSKLLDAVEQRFGEHNANAARRSSMMQTREQLKEELSRAKEQLSIELSKNQDFGRRVYEAEQEVTQLREQLRESHTHVRTLHGEKQRLEKQIHDLRARASAVETIPEAGGGGIVGGGSDWLSSVATAASAALAGQIKGSSSSNGGLRELRLGRSKSTPSQATPYSRRTSSMLTRNNTDVSLAASTAPPANETEALLLELVQAKTAEALARQEAEECRAKLDALHRQYGLPNSASAESGHQSQPLSATAANAAQAAMGVLGRFTMSITEGAAANNNNGATNGVTSSSTASYKPAVAQQAAGSSVATTASAAAASAAATVSSFWGGWRKG